MAIEERLGAFYLGRAFDSAVGGELADEPVMYDARDLTTHAVCVGMTGSGKTGLGVTLLEEAALDSIPSIIIDPKGDMTNLLLTFPELRPSDFRPWVNLDDARRKGLSVSAYAEQVAQTWSEGLKAWGQDGERIRRLRESADFAIYTPGSEAGVPLSALQSFDAPDLDWEEHAEVMREAIASTVSALLALIGVEADPVRSREHILLSHLLERAWRKREDVDLPRLIREIQDPPLERLGVFELETFYSSRDRMDLAMQLNALVASPSFASWREGVPLDVNRLLWTSSGKPKVSICYVAHLSEAERMFFVTLLLEQVVAWMRKQPGTTSLRALLYFDEVFGYFPPVANPPSKTPLLTLLKTARAYGLGIFLATQNPMDLDYKGLSNAGTWFVGKLQTDRDKTRLLDGMEGVVAQSGTLLDRRYMDRMISSLGSRVFVLHNVHEDGPMLYRTRWAMSYLRGPLTRSQVDKLMEPYKERRPAEAPSSDAPKKEQPSLVSEDTLADAGFFREPPRINARVAQYYAVPDIPRERALAEAGGGGELLDAALVYRPKLLGWARVRFEDSSSGTREERQVACHLPLPEPFRTVQWDAFARLVEDVDELESGPAGEAYFEAISEDMTDSPPYTRLRDAFLDYVYRDVGLRQWRNEELDLTSRPGESHRVFLERCMAEAANASRDALDELEAEYDKRVSKLDERTRKEEAELRQDELDWESRKREEILYAGESIVSVLLGRSRSRGLSQAERRRRMTAKARETMRAQEEALERLRVERQELLVERDRQMDRERRRWEDVADDIAEGVLRPRRTDIDLLAFGVLWAPHWALEIAGRDGRRRREIVSASREIA
ncbi:MAG: helicase HerA domain-containing protein [Anaerolineae bacterium]